MLGTSPRLLTRPISKTKQIGTLWGLSATFHWFIPRQETANSQKLVPGKRAYQHTSLGIWRLPSRLRWDSLRSESTVGSLFSGCLAVICFPVLEAASLLLQPERHFKYWDRNPFVQRIQCGAESNYPHDEYIRIILQLNSKYCSISYLINAKIYYVVGSPFRPDSWIAPLPRLGTRCVA